MVERSSGGPYNLRSSDGFKLNVPVYRRTTFGGRAFPVYAPRLWNALPLELRSIQHMCMFKKKLKTHLFTKFLSDGL